MQYTQKEGRRLRGKARWCLQKRAGTWHDLTSLDQEWFRQSLEVIEVVMVLLGLKIVIRFAPGRLIILISWESTLNESIALGF